MAAHQYKNTVFYQYCTGDNEVASKFLKLIPLLLVMYSGILSCAETYPTYFSPDNSLSLCDVYIKENARKFQQELYKIKKHYKDGEWEKLSASKKGKIFNEYINKLLECSDTYRFTNKINYFRTSHAYVLLLLDVARKRVNPKRAINRVNGIVSDIDDDIEKILISEKVKKPKNNQNGVRLDWRL
ncbi:MAG TPA: hypothetical protein ENJ28_11310 [Gammaproteobacteria bacterium]|nr:hypothetical protein [Gammaproteobacteria bacterium]